MLKHVFAGFPLFVQHAAVLEYFSGFVVPASFEAVLRVLRTFYDDAGTSRRSWKSLRNLHRLSPADFRSPTGARLGALGGRVDLKMLISPFSDTNAWNRQSSCARDRKPQAE
jgi:hypothetical protein